MKMRREYGPISVNFMMAEDLTIHSLPVTVEGMLVIVFDTQMRMSLKQSLTPPSTPLPSLSSGGLRS